MRSAREFLPLTAARTAHLPATLWARVCTALEAALNRSSAKFTVPAESSADCCACVGLPATKLAAISQAGPPVLRGAKALPVTPLLVTPLSTGERLARRPGVQGRWKTSDRVAVA